MIRTDKEMDVEIIPQVTVVASDGRRIGVRVIPFRSTPILTMLDLDNHPWMFSRSNLPPTTNAWIHAVADFKANHLDYSWDTPRYRELCVEGGLDPDYHRPHFAEQNVHAGEALVRALSQQSAWPSHAAVNIIFDLVDVLRTDQWRESTNAETLRSTVIYNAQYHPEAVEQALAMVRRALGSDTKEIAELLSIRTEVTYPTLP